MPTASGATSKVDVGADENKTWTLHGLKRNNKPANRNCDSYLQIYQEQKKRNKVNLMPNVQEKPAPCVQEENEEEVPKEETVLTNGNTGNQTSSGEKTKKSQLCVLL